MSEVDVNVASDLPRGVALLSDLTTNLSTVRATFQAFTEKIKDGKLNTTKGLSLLDLKNLSFLSYMTNLAYITQLKLKGLKIENDPSIERLVEHRVVLERIRPLEDKLKYQVDKYVKVAAEGGISIEDPLQLKGNLDNIGSSSDEEEEDTAQDQIVKTKKKNDEKQEIYKIPKISQTHYDGEDKSEVTKERARRRVLNSSMLRDALYEHTEDPEVVYNIDVLKQRSLKKRKELEMYEEDNMLRKTVSKRERASMREVSTLSTLGSEMLAFNSLDPLHQDYGPSNPASKKRRTTAGSAKGKKKGKKGFRKKGKH